MANKIANLWPLVPLALWVLFGSTVAFGSFTPIDQERDILWLGIGLLLLVFNLGLCVPHSTRPAALCCVVVLIIIAPAIQMIRGSRLGFGRRRLEAIYSDFAKRGPPFPDKYEASSDAVPGYMTWYYQQHSREKFAVVYLVSSNGWAMEYPSAKWHFIGYQPNGYVPRADGTLGPIDTNTDLPNQTRLAK